VSRRDSYASRWPDCAVFRRGDDRNAKLFLRSGGLVRAQQSVSESGRLHHATAILDGYLPVGSRVRNVEFQSRDFAPALGPVPMTFVARTLD
jgi:hypothetical protein